MGLISSPVYQDTLPEVKTENQSLAQYQTHGSQSCHAQSCTSEHVTAPDMSPHSTMKSALSKPVLAVSDTTCAHRRRMHGAAMVD